MKTLLFILSVFILFTGCKKYPADEGLLHLRTPEQRLKHFSPWELVEYTVDGADSLPYYKTHDYWKWIMHAAPLYYQKGFWKNTEFVMRKNRIVNNGFFNAHNNLHDNIWIWDIHRLDKKYFVVSSTYKGKLYTLKFESRK